MSDTSITLADLEGEVQDLLREARRDKASPESERVHWVQRRLNEAFASAPALSNTPSQGEAVALIPDALWPFIQHHGDCVLRGHWMEAADHDCDCGLADALTQAPAAVDMGERITAQAQEIDRLRAALEAMLTHYGPPGSLRDTLAYPADHSITKARAALQPKEQSNG